MFFVIANQSIHQSFGAGADASSAWGPIIRAAAISVNGTLVMFHITSVNMTLTAAREIEGPCGGARRAACGWHERVKREWVLGAVGRKFLPMGLSRADSLRGEDVAGDDAQPMGGRAMRRHFRSVQIRMGCFAAVAVGRYSQSKALSARSSRCN